MRQANSDFQAQHLFLINLYLNYLLLTNIETDYHNYDTDVDLQFPDVIHNICAYYKYIEYGLNGTSILHLTAITINRYIMVCHQ